jgi:hypothetical protein
VSRFLFLPLWFLLSAQQSGLGQTQSTETRPAKIDAAVQVRREKIFSVLGSTPPDKGAVMSKYCLNFSHIEAWPPIVPFDCLRLFWNGGDGWADINTASGVYNWFGMDKWLSTYGKDVMYTFGRTPTWAGGGSDFKGPPSDVDTTDAIWKAFVTALVTRYKGKIVAYGIWNEPDIAWHGTPAQMVTMARDAYKIIHAIDPAAKVISPEPSTSNQFGVHFLPAYYRAGGAPYQDIVGCHFYLYDGRKRPRTPNGFLQTSITSLKTLMHKYGLDAQPIWFTEGGWGQESDFTPPLTDAERSAWVTNAYTIMKAAGVERAYWYACDNQRWGTLQTNGVLTAAGVAFRDIQK